jgi:threonine aldolase
MTDTSVRLVTSWQTTTDEVAEAGARFREAARAAT